MSSFIIFYCCMACFNKSASHSPSLHSSMDSLELSLRHWPSFSHDLYSCKIHSNQVSTCMQLMSTCQSVDINMVSMYTPGPLWFIFYWKVSRHLPIVYEDNSSGKVDFQLFFFVWVSSVECKEQISIHFCLMTWLFKYFFNQPCHYQRWVWAWQQRAKPWASISYPLFIYFSNNIVYTSLPWLIIFKILL